MSQHTPWSKIPLSLGIYAIVEEAAKAYNEAAIKYQGEFARLNHVE